jgi:tetratricopeptide (TPR) repeat protein
MILQWFNARQASELGSALADKLTPCAARFDRAGADRSGGALGEMLQRAVNEACALRLNVYQRAKLANAFKWRLIENGIERDLADEVTQSLVVNISTHRGAESGRSETTASEAAESGRPPAGSARERAAEVQRLLAKGNGFFARGEYASALECYEELLELDPRNPDAINNVGSALFKLGRYIEAEQHFRGAMALKPDYPEVLSNLGNALRRRGYFAESEIYLRRAIKLKPNYLDAHCDLGSTLVFAGDLHGAKGRFKKVLKARPRHVDALLGMAQLAAMHGSWEEAGKLLDQVLEADPTNTRALAAQSGLRKMTPSDAKWLQAAEARVASGLEEYEESMLRFALGKYFDDVGEFARAFENYKRANDLLKPAAEPYDREARMQLVRDLKRVYTRDALAKPAPGASPSSAPIFVVGMPRSGTSLVHQIICSHPSASGAGEVDFWFDAVREHGAAIRERLIDEPLRRTLAEGYLRTLNARSGDAARVVDKAPLNSDFLGVIHSVFPNARMIYMQRDPVDSCLSCFFQAFPLTANFTLDLSDLAHYYREHQRLIDHWRAALPPGTLLDVPYAELVADQEGWTRRILDFVGLDWNEQCLNFQETNRAVVTASYWQVRQKIYATSVARWRNYEQFIGPLLSLKTA